MTSTLLILWNTFGFLGLASALAWAAAAGLLVAGIARHRRWDRWLQATAAAAVGLVLALATSASIRAIEVDRSAEVLAAEAAAAKATREKLRGRAADVRFAEDTAVDQADVAGVTVAEEEGAYERAVEAELARIPAYRARGKRARTTAATAKTDEGGKTDEEKSGEEGDPAGASPAGDEAAGGEAPAAATATTDPETGRKVRHLPEAQLIVADRFDRTNKAAAWSVLAVAAALCCGEYVRRFNSTFDAVWPLPLAGTPVDGLVAKQRIVAAPRSDDGGLARFLETAVRKGETFILFAADDPLAGRESLERVGTGRFAWRLPKRTFTAAEVAADPALAELVFESAWFGRAAFVLTGSAGAAEVVRGIAAALERRSRTRATIRRTLNLAWTWPAEPPDGGDLARRAERINYRWLREAAAA